MVQVPPSWLRHWSMVIVEMFYISALNCTASLQRYLWHTFFLLEINTAVEMVCIPAKHFLAFNYYNLWYLTFACFSKSCLWFTLRLNFQFSRSLRSWTWLKIGFYVENSKTYRKCVYTWCMTQLLFSVKIHNFFSCKNVFKDIWRNFNKCHNVSSALLPFYMNC